MDWESPKPPKPEESIAERLRARRSGNGGRRAEGRL